MRLSQSTGEDGLKADIISEADAPELTIVSRAWRNWVLFELVSLIFWDRDKDTDGHLHT